MQTIIKRELGKLKNVSYIDKKLYKRFLNRTTSEKPLIRRGSPNDHFSTFFLPVDKAARSIFLVHHIKANDWIPPGGHIERNEIPINTVIREMKEELGCKIDKSQVKLFNISITNIRNKRSFPCRRHWDLWYLVSVPKQDFQIDEKEFYDGKWFNEKEASSKTKDINQRKVIQKLLYNSTPEVE